MIILCLWRNNQRRNDPLKWGILHLSGCLLNVTQISLLSDAKKTLVFAGVYCVKIVGCLAFSLFDSERMLSKCCLLRIPFNRTHLAFGFAVDSSAELSILCFERSVYSMTKF